MSRKTSPSKSHKAPQKPQAVEVKTKPATETAPAWANPEPAPPAPTPKPVAAKVETAEERVERERKEMAAVVR